MPVRQRQRTTAVVLGLVGVLLGAAIIVAVADAATPAGGALTWGDHHTWPDGLTIEVAEPVACTPGEYAAPSDIQRAAKFTIVISNRADTAFDTTALAVGSEAHFAGRLAQPVFDGNGECGDGGFDFSAVSPGTTYTYSVAFAITPQPGEMQLVFQPGFGVGKAVFVGEA